MSVYDKDRVDKIGQIMPQFSQVAERGDKVLMGLEGDPMFPTKYRGSRPTATIENIEKNDDEYLVNLRMEDGTSKQVSSMSLSPNDVWEFTDDAFEGVMEREQERQESITEMNRSESELYRGTQDALAREITELKNELRAERELNKTFHNTVIDSFREFSNDICKLDTNKDCQFCHVFNNQYNSMMKNRAESSFDSEPSFRGNNDESESDESDYF